MALRQSTILSSFLPVFSKAGTFFWRGGFVGGCVQHATTAGPLSAGPVFRDLGRRPRFNETASGRVLAGDALVTVLGPALPMSAVGNAWVRGVVVKTRGAGLTREPLFLRPPAAAQAMDIL